MTESSERPRASLGAPAPDILDNMSRGWNRDPAGVALGTERTNISAALWTHGRDDVQDVHAEPDPRTHVIGLSLCTFRNEMFIDGQRTDDVPHQPGTICIVQAGRRPRAVTSGQWRLAHIYLPDRLLQTICDAEGLAAPELLSGKTRQDPVVDRIGREVVAEMGESRPMSRLRVDALGQDLAIQLLRRWSNLAGTRALARGLDRASRGSLAPWQARRATEYLEAHLADDIPLATLAKLVGLSPNHFCRAFRISMGEPPHRWLVRRRIERAKEMLADPRLSVTDVALAVGFGSSAHFATAFRNQMGVTPSDYRRERLS